MTGTSQSLLQAALGAAVPLWVARIQGELEDGRTSPDILLLRARALSQFLAEHGDDVLYRSKRAGGSSRAFNCLAEGLAIGAVLAPGGVPDFLGDRWVAYAHAGGWEFEELLK